MSSINRIIHHVPYKDWNDPVKIFSPFAQEPYAMLFDSAGAKHPDSRYDIIVRSPNERLESIDGKTFINSKLTNEPDYFKALEEAVKRLGECAHEDLPFTGGALGFFGYDMGRTVEKMPAQAIQDISIPDAAFGIYERAIVIDHKAQCSYLIAPENSTLNAEVEFWQTPGSNNENAAKASQAFKLTSSWESNLSEPEYHTKFQKIIDYLCAGDAYQINFAQRFSASFTGSAWQAYQKLRAKNKAPFSGFIHLDSGSILSVSPERFVKVEDFTHVQTRPIKGTRPRGSTPERDQEEGRLLLQSEKDRAENLMIVDLLRNDMSRVCQPGSVHVPELFKLESFPAVHHLVSTVVGKLHPYNSAFDLMRAIFPGGSITGAPKVRAMEIIEELEPHRRSVYCGSLAYFSTNGNADSSITIRTLCSFNGHLYCWAGGGIVIDSTQDVEYRETFDKVAKILPTLNESS